MPLGRLATNTKGILLDTLLAKIQKLTVWALAGMLLVVIMLSTAHLGGLIAQEIWKPP